jgi:hypothetical protein
MLNSWELARMMAAGSDADLNGKLGKSISEIKVGRGFRHPKSKI